MKWVSIFIALFVFVTTLFSQIGSRTQVAVMNLDASGIEASAIIALSDRLRYELLNTGRFDVMERNRMDDILKEQGFQQSGCTTTECVVEVGKMLGVARMISGSVGKVGRIYTLSVRMIDIETGRIMISKTEDCECPIEKVLTQSIGNVAMKLAGLAPGQTPAGQVMPTVVEGKGDFYFKSDPPGAKVFINNQEVPGRTPNSLEGVQAGMHVIRMETEQYSGSETVFLEANEFKRVELKLERSKGGLKVISNPFEAELYIDNVKRGVTPFTAVGLDAGEHIIRVSKDGYIDHTEGVQVKGDETARIEVSLQQWAYLTLHSVPEACRCI